MGTVMDPIVHLSPSASLKGTITHLEGNDKPVYTYLGIPFAEPPVRELRLKKPVPKKLWNGQRDATKNGPGPTQDIDSMKMLFEAAGFKLPERTGEDCLYLNVYTPSKNASDSLPVMVWIYGGAFSIGFVDCYMGTPFASLHDVVFVAINYRVGPLGFFTTGDETCLGNFGLWDQIEGMKWVQEHISKFGGDPTNVTLFGESAGGISTSLHHVAKPSHGLFKRAIHQSGVGTVMGSLLTPQEDRDLCTEAAKALELPEKSSPTDVHAALLTMPAEEITKKMAMVSFRPAVDGELFTEDSLTSYEKGDFYKSNSMFTINTDEGAIIHKFLVQDMGLELKSRNDFLDIVKNFMGQQKIYPVKNFEGFSSAALQEYVHQENPTEDELLLALIEFLGDAHFQGPNDTFIKLHSDAVPEGTYYGVFGYRTSISQNIPAVKADHGEEVASVFGFSLLSAEDNSQKEWSESDKEMSKTMLAYWCNFAKTGNPSGPSSSHLPNWPCFTSQKRSYLYMDETCSLREDYKPSRRNFWATVPQKFCSDVAQQDGNAKL